MKSLTVLDLNGDGSPVWPMAPRRQWTGRLLSIERKTRIAGGTTLEVDYLSLISDTGEVKTTEVAPGFSVRLPDPGQT